MSPCDRRERTAREVAATAELGQERALGAHRAVRHRVVDRGEPVARVDRSSARHSTASAPCATCGSITAGDKHLGHRAGQLQPLERGVRDDDRVEAFVVELAQAGLDVAAQPTEQQVGTSRGELRAPPDGTGADAPAGGDRIERGADERVARVGPFGNRGKDETRRVAGRQILGRVHREIGAVVEHGLLHFLHEHALAPDLVELGRLIGVALRLHEDVLDAAAEPGADALGLPAREPAPSRRDPKAIPSRQREGRTTRRARRRSSRHAAYRPLPSRAPSARGATC